MTNHMLYGTTFTGQMTTYSGTIFSFNVDSMIFSNLYSFTPAGNFIGSGTNIDGANPYAGLVLSGDTLYGNTAFGGKYGFGTVFSIKTNGLSFTNLYNFTGGSDGKKPHANLILSSNILYGTTAYGGSGGNGNLFALNTDGTGFTNLYSFNGGNDGAAPIAGLILSGNTLYGAASSGGVGGSGTLFAINTDGTGFTNLYSFSAVSVGTNSDGASPQGSLILSGNILYGTTYEGGALEWGTVFSFSLPLPKLAITLSGTNVILTWPANVNGFVLQSTTNLLSPVWVTINGQNTVTNSISDQQRFYRLNQPSP